MAECVNEICKAKITPYSWLNICNFENKCNRTLPQKRAKEVAFKGNSTPWPERVFQFQQTTQIVCDKRNQVVRVQWTVWPFCHAHWQITATQCFDPHDDDDLEVLEWVSARAVIHNGLWCLCVISCNPMPQCRTEMHRHGHGHGHRHVYAICNWLVTCLAPLTTFIPLLTSLRPFSTADCNLWHVCYR